MEEGKREGRETIKQRSKIKEQDKKKTKIQRKKQK